MASEYLATYLNDHLAGSVAAIELLEQLEEDHKGAPLQTFFSNLRAEVSEDQEQLKTLINKLSMEESIGRKISAWFTEKISELKLKVDDPDKGTLRLLQSVEVLEIGIQGKKLLWEGLKATSQQSASLALLDYEKLIQRAEDQIRRVEAIRLEAARNALLTGKSRSA